MKKSVLLLLLSTLFTYGSVYAQLRVTGTVLDAATSEPMAGASVIEQGTTNGTTTDTKGRFAISVKNHQSVLTFSFIGMYRRTSWSAAAPICGSSCSRM